MPKVSVLRLAAREEELRDVREPCPVLIYELAPPAVEDLLAEGGYLPSASLAWERKTAEEYPSTSLFVVAIFS